MNAKKYIIVILLLMMPSVMGAEIFVDILLSSDCSGTYSKEDRDCSGSDGDAFDSIEEGIDAGGAGDVVNIRGGTYNEIMHLTTSGNSGSPITFQNYDDETVTIADVDSRDGGTEYGPIWLDHVDYNVVDGIDVTGSVGFGRGVDAHHNIIKNCDFLGSTFGVTSKSKRGGFYFAWSDHNKILNNYFLEGTDSLSFVSSNYNLIEGNEFLDAGHTCFTIKCGSYNVVRNNSFSNHYEKTGEIFDCEAATTNWHGNAEFAENIEIHDSTIRNLVEGNEFTYTSSSGDSSPYAGIQYAGQYGIIRNNIFRTTVGPGLGLTLYGDEAEYDHSNRIYNNVFYGTDFSGIEISGSTSYTMYDNIMKNNILSGSIFVANDERWSWYTEVLEGKPVQLKTGRIEDFKFRNNNLFYDSADEPYLITYGRRDSSSNPDQHDVEWYETNHPEVFSDNLVEDPLFVSEQQYDFHLADGSLMIDEGDFLTTADGTDFGTQLIVEDASYFFDGFGIDGEIGDLIQLEESGDMAYISYIDYDDDILELDRSLSWSDGEGVSLAYSGDAPDIGAYEFGGGYDCDNPHPDWLFCDDFESRDVGTHPYDSDHIWSYQWPANDNIWFPSCSPNNNGCQEITDVESVSGFKSVRLAQAQGATNNQISIYLGDHPTDSDWTSFNSRDEIYVKFQKKWDEGYDFYPNDVRSHQFLLFAGDRDDNTKTDFTAYLDYNLDHRFQLTAKAFYQGDEELRLPDCDTVFIGENKYLALGPNTPNPSPELVTGVWYDVEIRAKMNSFTGSTPNCDGILQLWIDGNLVNDYAGILRDTEHSDIQWNALVISDNYPVGPEHDQESYIDDFIISSSRIGGSGEIIDDPCDSVSLLELTNLIDDWLDGSISTDVLMDGISEWKDGC